MIAYFFSISQNPTGYDKVLVRNLSDTGVVWTSLPGSVYRHVIKDISPMSRQTDALTGIWAMARLTSRPLPALGAMLHRMRSP
jgi:hypothetical protein